MPESDARRTSALIGVAVAALGLSALVWLVFGPDRSAASPWPRVLWIGATRWDIDGQQIDTARYWVEAEGELVEVPSDAIRGWTVHTVRPSTPSAYESDASRHAGDVLRLDSVSVGPPQLDAAAWATEYVPTGRRRAHAGATLFEVERSASR